MSPIKRRVFSAVACNRVGRFLPKVIMMTTTNEIAYFETDQIKLALVLWKAAKKAHQTDFNVLKFTSQWNYADVMLQELILSEDPETAEHAIHLMQVRISFTQQFPERAKKMGAVSAATTPFVETQRPKSSPLANSPASPEPDPPATPPTANRYVKGVR